MARDIKKLHPKLQEIVDKLKARCEKEGLNILITSCIRDAKEQKECYDKKTSRLLYPNSHHNWGTAFDFCKNVKGHEYDDVNFFKNVGKIAKSLGLIWGGDFSKPDRPHCQLADWGNSVSKLKKQYGTPEKFMATWNQSESTHSVPSPSIPIATETYKVVKGDTLSGIGAKLGVAWKEIAEINGIKSPYIINIGQVLKVNTDVKTTYMDVTGCTTLRCRKTANGDIIGFFAKGAKVEVLDQSNKSWYKVSGKGTNGKTVTGYCGSRYLK